MITYSERLEIQREKKISVQPRDETQTLYLYLEFYKNEFVTCICFHGFRIWTYFDGLSFPSPLSSHAWNLHATTIGVPDMFFQVCSKVL